MSLQYSAAFFHYRSVIETSFTCMQPALMIITCIRHSRRNTIGFLHKPLLFVLWYLQQNFADEKEPDLSMPFTFLELYLSI